MVQELRTRSQADQIFRRALSAAFHSRHLWRPEVWSARDPETLGKMLRDADIKAAVVQRVKMVAGRQWTLEPQNPDEADESRLAVKVGTALLGKLAGFTQARAKLAQSFLTGQQWAEIRGMMRVAKIGDGKPRKWWFPVRMKPLDPRAFQIAVDANTREDGIHTHWDRWDVAKEELVPVLREQMVDMVRCTHDDDDSSLGYGRGLIDALGFLWYTKEHVFHESIQAVERFAQGLLTVKVDGLRNGSDNTPNTEAIRQWVEVLEEMRGQHVAAYDAGDQIEHIQVSGTGWEMLRDMRMEIRAGIKTLILGADLTTGSGENGSYGLAAVQENSTEMLVQDDREVLGEALTGGMGVDGGLLSSVWHHNWANMVELGIAELMPRFNIKQEKMVDPQQRAAVAKTAHEIGLPLAKDDVYEQLGFRRPQDGEEVLDGAEPVAAGMPGGELDLFGTGGNFGRLPGIGKPRAAIGQGDDVPAVKEAE
jgi:hypothetical protein